MNTVRDRVQYLTTSRSCNQIFGQVEESAWRQVCRGVKNIVKDQSVIGIRSELSDE